jgi:hypothetical protein
VGGAAVSVTRLCDETFCVDPAVALVRVLDVKLRELITCRPCAKHLAEMREAHAKRPATWPVVHLIVKETSP